MVAALSGFGEQTTGGSMKRVLVFLAATIACVGLLAGPAAAAGGLQKFNIDDTAYTYPPGFGYVSGVLLCNPSTTGPYGYQVSLTVTQGSTTGFAVFTVQCTGSTEHWNTDLEQNGPIFPGKAHACASAEKLYYVATTGDRVSSTVCKTIKFFQAY
jgi:hypothetical protein